MALREEFGCRKGGQKHTEPDAAPEPETEPAEPDETDED